MYEHITEAERAVEGEIKVGLLFFAARNALPTLGYRQKRQID
jgi:hypothetical protein